MQRHSFIEMTKLSNVEGRISYITSEKKQEFLYATYDTEDSSFWVELARCCQAEFKKNGTNGKCIEARELVIALPEEFINIKPDELLEFFVEKFREKYDVPCLAAIHHNKRKTNLHIHLIFSERRSHRAFYQQSRNEYDREKEAYEMELYADKGNKEKEKEILSTSAQTDIEDEKITDTTIVNTVFATHAPKQEPDRELDYNTIMQTPETPIISEREEPVITLLALPPVPVKPILSYDYTEMYYLNEQLKQQQDSIFFLQKERNTREIERDDLGRFNVIKKNKLTGEIDNLEKQIAKEKRELSSVLKQHGYETASEFMKVFRELKGRVDGYNRKATEWNEQKRQIEALNQRIVSGEMSLDSAIQFMSERGYMAKTVRIKVSELSEDVSIRASIARSRHRADEHNRSRQQRNRDRNSRGAR